MLGIGKKKKKKECTGRSGLGVSSPGRPPHPPDMGRGLGLLLLEFLVDEGPGACTLCPPNPNQVPQPWANLWVSLRESPSVVSDFLRPRGLQSMEFPRSEHLSGLPFLSPGHLPNPAIEPGSPALQADSLPSELRVSLNQST